MKRCSLLWAPLAAVKAPEFRDAVAFKREARSSSRTLKAYTDSRTSILTRLGSDDKKKIAAGVQRLHRMTHTAGLVATDDLYFSAIASSGAAEDFLTVSSLLGTVASEGRFPVPPHIIPAITGLVEYTASLLPDEQAIVMMERETIDSVIPVLPRLTREFAGQRYVPLISHLETMGLLIAGESKSLESFNANYKYLLDDAEHRKQYLALIRACAVTSGNLGHHASLTKLATWLDQLLSNGFVTVEKDAEFVDETGALLVFGFAHCNDSALAVTESLGTTISGSLSKLPLTASYVGMLEGANEECVSMLMSSSHLSTPEAKLQLLLRKVKDNHETAAGSEGKNVLDEATEILTSSIADYSFSAEIKEQLVTQFIQITDAATLVNVHSNNATAADKGTTDAMLVAALKTLKEPTVLASMTTRAWIALGALSLKTRFEDVEVEDPQKGLRVAEFLGDVLGDGAAGVAFPTNLSLAASLAIEHLVWHGKLDPVLVLLKHLDGADVLCNITVMPPTFTRVFEEAVRRGAPELAEFLSASRHKCTAAGTLE